MARPPPTRTAKPSRQSLITATREMQLISGMSHCAGHADTVILCLRGRSRYSAWVVKYALTSSTTGETSNVSSARTPARGQPVMLRTVSPQPVVVFRPAWPRWSRISGTCDSLMKWSWTFCLVESSAYPSPYWLAISPMARKLWGGRRPPGTLIRIMKEPTFGLSWYRPYHWSRTMSSSETSR